jgi:hypothetical protein
MEGWIPYVFAGAVLMVIGENPLWKSLLMD